MTTQGEPPAPLMQGLGDTFTAMAGVAGILAALHEREQHRPGPDGGRVAAAHRHVGAGR